MKREHGVDHRLVDAVLVGGPADIPPEARVRKVVAAETRIKLVHRGGYEHFEADGEAAGSSAGDGSAQGGVDPVEFVWTMRTKIAE
jgi:hypothetical protein